MAIRLITLLALILLFMVGKYFLPFPYTASQQKIRPTSNVQSTPQFTLSKQEALVIKVIDGDTIEIEGGQKVRYIGIDTPETKHPQKAVQCFGKEASEKNKELVEEKRVRLEKDVSEKDKYGRLLRYVYLPAGKAGVGEIFINDYLVRQGYAYAATFPPDVKYQQLFLDAQKEARENNRGLWNGCR